jgi:RNA polymerase sigma-70 factor, ECF subfamily
MELMSEPTDLALMDRIATRDTDALRALYDRYGRVAFALAYRVTGEASAAEEIVQDAFVTVWEKGSGFDATKGGNVRGWLLTIVHRRAIDVRRREYDRPPPNVPIDTMDNVLATPDVWKDVSANLLGENVRHAMAALPDQQRRTIELAYFEGLSHGEIASRENAPVGTVKGRLRLGLSKLSTLLDTDEQAHEPMRGERV